MKFENLLLVALSLVSLALPAQAQLLDNGSDEIVTEFDPYAPNAADQLQEFDAAYEAATGLPSHLTPDFMSLFQACYQQSCPVFAYVDKASQRMSLYVNGQLQGTFATSSGVPGHGTPDFDTHPDGRIYDAYSSSKYPGGDYNGLGNMPYAVFISGGFAIHGTPRGNWPLLGRAASHGCIRIHPDNAFRFNRLVRQYGIAATWITVD